MHFDISIIFKSFTGHTYIHALTNSTKTDDSYYKIVSIILLRSLDKEFPMNRTKKKTLCIIFVSI